MHACMFLCIVLCMHACFCAWFCACMHVFVHIHACMHVFVHSFVHACMFLCAFCWPIFPKSKNAKNCTKEAAQSSNPFHLNPKGGNRPSRIFLAHFPEIEKCQKLHQRSPPELKPLPFEPEGGKSTLAHLLGTFSRNRKIRTQDPKTQGPTRGTQETPGQNLAKKLAKNRTKFSPK